MAISNEIIIIGIGIIFTYLVVYRKNKFFGNLLYFATGILLASYSTTTIITAMGFIIMAGGLISLIYDLINKNTLRN